MWFGLELASETDFQWQKSGMLICEMKKVDGSSWWNIFHNQGDRNNKIFQNCEYFPNQARKKTSKHFPSALLRNFNSDRKKMVCNRKLISLKLNYQRIKICYHASDWPALIYIRNAWSLNMTVDLDECTQRDVSTPDGINQLQTY